ncbi:unnamed protein product [Triticum turgidum subsp. durum]|uniref:Glycosyl hydrolase family 32 N-terminal domain-containing protein n=1 Tax=Triticum turgidum subsp. durum TaxID=4567 RepID=A0A9R0Z0T9_TRITD|nr:unnamed protein product [Triticum turgidum subsp. durum]
MGSHGKPPLPYAYKPLPSGAAAAADADGERTGWTRWRVCATVLTASAMVVVVVGATLLAGFRVDQAVDEEAAAGFPWSNEMLQWQRSGYHFQTAKNYMSDPNGLMYYNGWYHMFFQYNPVGTDWDDGMEWGHAVSRNLVTWRTLPIAMVADQWYDILGVLSGSMTVLPNGTVIMIYTGATNASAVEVQCIATPADPNDPFLRRWTKHPANPVIWSPPGIGTKDFRDPMTAWYDESDDTWRTLLGSKDDHDGHHDGIAMMYKTKDFLNYELIPGILHRVQRTGEWECIDFYPVGHRTSDNSSEMLHVLKASMDDERHDYYSLGTYDSAANTWTPIDPELDLGIGLRYDWGKFYASTSFYDPAKKRRVLMGYVGEVDSKRADVVKGWASIQSVPRTIALDEKTRTNLLLWPVEEIETLRLNATKLSDVTLNTGSVIHIPLRQGTQLDIEATFHLDASAVAALPRPCC